MSGKVREFDNDWRVAALMFTKVNAEVSVWQSELRPVFLQCGCGVVF